MRNRHRQDNRARQPLRFGAVLLFATLATACSREQPTRVEGGDPVRGRLLAQQYQCAACHYIPEVQGANGDAGPSLKYMGRLSYIAGSIPNQPENMVRFLQNPPAVKPGTLMPALGVSEQEARHMAAFMYTLR